MAAHGVAENTLPVSVDIIILGQEYVTAGQIVDAVAQSDIAAQDEVK